MTKFELRTLGDQILVGYKVSMEEAQAIAALPDEMLWELMAIADRVRHHFKGDRVHTCAILNGKSGKCSEDCAYCSQSHVATTDAPIYGLMSKEQMQEAAMAAYRGGADRFAVVTSGRALPSAQVSQIAEAIAGLPQEEQKTHWCSSLGILAEPELRVLYAAGVTRFHHNLETARSHYPNICTTHTYDERIATIRAAQRVGMSVCSGGIFGLGETDAQAAEFALELRDLNVDSVPINFLIPIPGTRLHAQNLPRISPRRCLKLIALFRLVLPSQDILICGGRVDNLGELHPLVLCAGANGIMTGNYLTRDGRTPAHDRALLEAMGRVHGLQ
ncbi:MAG TPA: biotin synthase BioB [Fibrobacteraceae bacterium]|nr:biotin synthase BioB [Fibrobacteraceae bacterium]